LASSACFLYYNTTSASFPLGKRGRKYIQPNAPNRSNLLLRQWRQNSTNNSRLAGWRARVKHRAPAVDVHLHILAVAHGEADVDVGVDGLA
jgi:hypothetical protein